MWRAQPEITLNQRLWVRQRYNPKLCSYCKKVDLVFLRNIHGNFIACEAVKVVESKDGRKIIDEHGMISMLGKRIGWPVHNCKDQKNVVVNEDDIPLPEFEPVPVNYEFSPERNGNH